MQLSREQLLLIGSVVLQFIVLFGMIFFYQGIFIGGTEVILRTEPVDPRDLLRGQYVALRYDISTLEPGLFQESEFNTGERSLLPGETLYVSLEPRGGTIWMPTRATRVKPSDGVAIRGTVEGPGGPGGTILVHYGIESYFVDPERAKELEAQARRGTLLMRVVVDSDGKAVIKGVYEGGDGGAVLGIGNAQMRSRDARRITDIKKIQLALELYFDANRSRYPSSLDLLTSNFIPSLPRDPADGASYSYFRCADGLRYHLGADLEALDNPALASDADVTALCPGDMIQGNDQGSCLGAVTNRFCHDMAP